MKTVMSIAAILLLARTSAIGHRLDEYLQATLISVGKNRVQAQIRLIPGVAVLPMVLGSIDTDANATISDAEQRSYAERVLHDLSLTLDGDRLPLRLASMRFPKVEEMKQGLGEIQLEFEADVPGGGLKRRLTFENHHRGPIAAYLVNCLVPQDPDIRITAQKRNYQQSFYELEYTQAASAWLPGAGGLLGIVALLLSARLTFLWRQRRSLDWSACTNRPNKLISRNRGGDRAAEPRTGLQCRDPARRSSGKLQRGTTNRVSFHSHYD